MSTDGVNGYPMGDRQPMRITNPNNRAETGTTCDAKKSEKTKEAHGEPYPSQTPIPNDPNPPAVNKKPNNKGIEVEGSEEKCEPPFRKVNPKEAKEVAELLIDKLAPLYATSAVGSWFADIVGNDDGRFEDVCKLFDKRTIDYKNIVEVLQNTDLEVLERLIHKLDDDHEPEIRTRIGNCLIQRAEVLLDTGYLSQTDFDKLNKKVEKMIKDDDFQYNLRSAYELIEDRGIR